MDPTRTPAGSTPAFTTAETPLKLSVTERNQVLPIYLEWGSVGGAGSKGLPPEKGQRALRNCPERAESLASQALRPVVCPSRVSERDPAPHMHPASSTGGVRRTLWSAVWAFPFAFSVSPEGWLLWKPSILDWGCNKVDPESTWLSN